MSYVSVPSPTTLSYKYQHLRVATSVQPQKRTMAKSIFLYTSLCLLVLFNGCLAQRSWQQQQFNQCQLDRLNALEPNNRIEAEAGVISLGTPVTSNSSALEWPSLAVPLSLMAFSCHTTQMLHNSFTFREVYTYIYSKLYSKRKEKKKN